MLCCAFVGLCICFFSGALLSCSIDVAAPTFDPEGTHISTHCAQHALLVFNVSSVFVVVFLPTDRSHRNEQLLVRMERRGSPLRILLEACSFIFGAALAMAGGPAAPGSPTLAFAGGVMETEGAAGAVGGAKAGGSQEAWEAFNRHMDEQDKAIAEAAAAVAAAADGAAGSARGDGGGRGAARERELPTAMVEVLKVSLSLLRRFSSRNLTVAGAYASSMHMWPSGHLQVCWGWMEAKMVIQK